MKRNALSTLAVIAAALLFIGAGGGMGGNGRSGGGKFYRRRRVAVPRTAMPKPQHVVRDQSRPAYPQKDERGARISKPAATAPPAHHADVARNAGFARGVPRVERTEVVPNHYYWHNENGMRYSHYYDGRNHWYGFYHGPSFYWTRYYGDRWWWFDGGAARWVFWGNGYWWWAGPGGVPYVYMDNGYYPYEGAGVTVVHEENQPAPASIPAAEKGGAKTSPDGKRMVQISGADAQSFLYDNTVAPPTFLKYLGQGVSKVRFTGGTAGAPVQIMVEFKDDTFALFDADGNSQSAAVNSSESAAGTPPPAPDSIPPAPTSAPGQ
ncbi:MAG: hypothetical protein ACHQ2Z_03915 [Elusimicrobiota bacterium]